MAIKSVMTKGFLALTDEIQKMADEFADGGGEGVSAMVKAGAEPILQQAKANAPVSPGGGTLRDSLKTVIKKRGSRTKARIGAQKGGKGFYATFVEYGHGGPHPAPAHPFLAPAYDAKSEEAYETIKNALKQKLGQK